MYIDFDVNKEFGFKAYVYHIKTNMPLSKASVSNQFEIIFLLSKPFVIIIKAELSAETLKQKFMQPILFLNK